MQHTTSLRGTTTRNIKSIKPTRNFSLRIIKPKQAFACATKLEVDEDDDDEKYRSLSLHALNGNEIGIFMFY